MKRVLNEQGGNNRVANNTAEKFIGALTELESARDVELMVALFADDCEVGTVAAPEKFRGIEGARMFWTNYRAAFRNVRSVFQNELYFDNEAVFEWTTEGKSRNGRRIKYEGVSILETKGEKITRFCAYFDPKKLGRQIIKQNGGSGMQDRIF